MSDYVAEAAREELMFAEFPINVDRVNRAGTPDDVMVEVETDISGEAEFTAEFLTNGETEFADEDEFREALVEGARIAIAETFGISEHKVTISDLTVR